MANSRIILVLMASIGAISTAANLVRRVPDMHPIAIAFWRTAAVAVILAPTLAAPRSLRPRGSMFWWSIGAGLCLAFHFWAWFASLQLTTVIRSTVLVCLTPIWAGLWSWTIFKEPPSIRFWVGIGIALVGVISMTQGSTEAGSAASMEGDLLALAGGFLSGTYLTIGRGVRAKSGWGPYGAILCASCAGWLVLLALISGASLAVVGSNAVWVLAAMALGPQLIGHIGFAWLVRYVPATIIGAAILLEPVGATALGTVILDEWPSTEEVVGGIIILLGVLVATVRKGTAE
ncbi:MAG: DMT family transporter [Myxococcota bacterium]|nr:DMT family transporter [Myxococcota bacterium]